MRKSRVILFLSLLCVLVLLATGLFACKKKTITDPSEGRVVTVATAMETVYAAMLSSDGSVDTNYFTLKTNGSYTSGETVYDFTFGGTFDVTQNNRDDDKRSQLLVEVKKGGIEVFLMYYFDGKLYVDFPPYASRGMIADVNLAEVVHSVKQEKESGVIKTAADTLPLIASRIFTSCRCYSEEGGDRYVFTLSYPLLFDAFGEFVSTWDAGFSPEELLSALHLTEEETQELSASAPKTTVTFVVKDGVFLSAKAEAENKGSLSLDSFALTRGSDDLELPAALSSFTEFDLKNFSLSGTMLLHAQGVGDRGANFDMTVNRDFGDVTYSFTYDLKTHYVAGQGLELSLTLTDQNNKTSYFAVRGDYLYVDLYAYGIAKCKIKTEELSSRLGTMGFKDVGEYDFRDKLHLLVLLAAGREEQNDVVTYTLGKEFFSLLSEKIGYLGLFDVESATLSWNKANNRLQDLSASMTFGGITASLTASSFTFGTPVALDAVNDDAYVDLAEKQVARLSLSGDFVQNTRFETDGEVLSELISSLSGEELTFTATSLQYSAELVLNGSGSVKTFLAHLYAADGSEVINVYYTGETPDNFYLIYPENRVTGIRTLKTLTFAEDPLAAFNEAIGVADDGTGRRMVLAASQNSFTVGMQRALLTSFASKIAKIYPDFSLSLLTDVRCRRYELRMTKDVLTAKVVFDSDNDLSVVARSYKVTFDDDWGLTSLTAATPETVAVLADNDMPQFATASFTGGLTYRVSLLKEGSDTELLWSYEGVPDGMGNAGQITNVQATATLLGKAIETTVKVDLSPASAVEFANSAAYGDRFSEDENGVRTFTMSYYNDATPAVILGSFRYLTVTVGQKEYSKDIVWDLEGVSTSLEKSDFTVRPKVKTYFGNLISLGSVANCTLHIEGSVASSTDYTMTFVAYDGKNPLDPAVYSDVLLIRTEGGEDVEVRHVEWDLTNASIESKIKYNMLYAYSTDPEHPDIMRARVYDSTGAYEVLEIPVFFEARVVEKADVSFDVSTLDGVQYDAQKGFTFDVLKVRGLSPTKTEGVLPNAFVVNAEDSEKRWEVSGVKWSFDEVPTVLNASGAVGVLTMTIGDNISGFQDVQFNYAFTSVTVTGTTLLTAEKGAVLGIDKVQDSLYDYAGEHLNAYGFTFPAYVRVDYTMGDSADHEDLLIDWQFDKPFEENALADGGVYTLRGAVGSEELTVTLSFDRKRITSYIFVDEATMLSEGALVVRQGKICLAFSVLSAMAEENPVKYTDKANYPTTLLVAFNDGDEYVPVAVEWDLSAYDDREDMIGSGFLGTVSATAKGQTFDVYVYVSPAYDAVYTDSGCTVSDLTFSLMRAGELAQDGVHHKLVVTDPRDEASYQTVLYISGGKSLKVKEWLGLEAVSLLYSENYDTAPNAVSGSVTVRAKVGNDDVGYKEIPIRVSIVDSLINEEEIRVSGLPFAASSEMTGGSTPYAVTPTYAPFVVKNAVGDNVECSFSLDANPYYVDPKAATTYPAYLDFELDGIAVRAEAKWDLDAIPANAATVTESKEYLVWAMLDIGSSFKKIKIPVAVTVEKREIDVVWIKDNEGKYSSEKYIDLDGYQLDPFGDDVVGDEVLLDVKVQFKKDANRYPLKLKYSKKNVVLSYDGSNIYENITVKVGNESGGYTEIGGYTIRILAGIVSKIRVNNGGVDRVFFESVKDIDTNNITYKYYSAVDMANELPSAIKVTFGLDGAETVVPVSTGNDAGKGIVFAWDRDEHNYLGVVLWNPSVSAEVGGVRQAIYNSEQSNYATPTEEMFFDGSFTASAVYCDGVDDAGFITAASFLADRDEEILVTKIEKSYQNRYITTDDDPSTPFVGVLSVGTYRLYVSVEGHEQYSGKVYKTFTITPKDVSAHVTLYVNGARRTEEDPHEKYIGSAFAVSAKVADYGIDVPLLVDGVATQSVTDVNYQVGTSKVIPYAFDVTVDTSDLVGRNYKVEGAQVKFKITEASLPESANLDIRVTWAPSRNEFDVVVKAFNKSLSYDPDLTEGYRIYYYESASSLEEVSVFTAGETYYYTLEVKIPNYAEVDRIRVEKVAS